MSIPNASTFVEGGGVAQNIWVIERSQEKIQRLHNLETDNPFAQEYVDHVMCEFDALIARARLRLVHLGYFPN